MHWIGSGSKQHKKRRGKSVVLMPSNATGGPRWLPRAERFVRHALLAEPAFLDLHWRKEMVNSTFPRPIGIDSSLCLLSQHTWRRILPRRCHLDRRRGGCCPATATGANPHHVRRRPERLNCCRPSPFSVACPVLPFVSLTLRYTRLFVQLSRARSS